MNYLEWINQCTPTRWWHDSGNPAEIDLALKRGATGVTTNPVLTFRSFTSEPDFWTPKVSWPWGMISPPPRHMPRHF